MVMADEQALFDRLTALIREVYREPQADEIIQTFEAVFLAGASPEAQRQLLEYWIDFYRLQEYKHAKQRRRPTYQERITACSACGYPSSHRHHLWDMATHGENKVTVQLCANCHELHHLMYNALVKNSEYSRRIVLHDMFSGLLRHEIILKILGWVLATIRYEAGNGWIDGSTGSREHVEKRLRWSEYLSEQQKQKSRKRKDAKSAN
jgi:ribosomal protein L37E